MRDSNPWPSCSVEINGQPVKLGLADVAPTGAGKAGEVIGSDAHGLLVVTGQGVLRLRKLQRPGGKLSDSEAEVRRLRKALDEFPPNAAS